MLQLMALHSHAHCNTQMSQWIKKNCAGSKNSGVYERSWTEGVGTGFEQMGFFKSNTWIISQCSLCAH